MIVKSAEFKDISCHLLESLLDVFGAAREHWQMSQGYQNSDGEAQQVRNWPQCLGRLVQQHPATVTS
jgi:hypothetical protein